MEPQHSPAVRRILLGVSGGIAAYKAAELTRLLVKAGCEVQVVTTAAAERFVTPTTFQALSGRPVRSSLWDEHAEAAMSHIELARWPDIIVLAPASADLLAHLAAGLASDLLTTLCLATDKPIHAVPAMNRLMWAHPATQANVATLCARGISMIGPEIGSQACGEIGEGRMSEPDYIVAMLVDAPVVGRTLYGLKAVVTAGPTREPLDPVRFLTNRSSGKQGFAVARALSELGATVTLIAGPVTCETPAGIHRIDVTTARQMLEATLQACERADLLVGAAAVADYRPRTRAKQKLKKTAAAVNLPLVRNEDIIASARAHFPKLFIVGFAAETEQLEKHAQSKLFEKKLDLVAANPVDNDRAFDSDNNTLTVYWDGGALDLGHGGKSALAKRLVSVIVERLNPKTP